MSRVVPRLHLQGLAGHSTDDLMALVQQGDTLAFEALYYRMLPIIRGFLAARESKPHLTEDCVQEVFCRVWQQQGRFTCGNASARTYLLGVTLNVHREFCRKSHGTGPLPVHGASVTAANLEVGAELVSVEIMADSLRCARLTLSDKQSAAVALVYDKGIGPSEAANRLGCTEKALRRRLEKARRKLYDYLQPRQRIARCGGCSPNNC